MKMLYETKRFYVYSKIMNGVKFYVVSAKGYKKCITLSYTLEFAKEQAKSLERNIKDIEQHVN